MKPVTYEEGPQAWDRFKQAVKKVLSVPHDELQRRIGAERKASDRKPKRGPKRKL